MSMKGGIDADIEKLYQGPLDDFTAARNLLAKGAGKRAAEVRALVKPAVPAWAVNQVYWRRRPIYDALMHAAQDARKAHAAVLAGRGGDVRAAGKEHDARVSAALDAALGLLREGGHPQTDATRQAIVTTLRALPGDEPPGMLTKPLQPGGFEALAGLSIRGAKAPVALKPAPKPAAKPEKDEPAQKRSARDEKAIAKARDVVASAARALKQAETAAQREEFERARTAREAEKADKAVTAARKAVEEAEAELEEAQAAAESAVKKKDAAERRSRGADESVDAARSTLDAAQQALDRLTR
jgi:hypothetical protein